MRALIRHAALAAGVALPLGMLGMVIVGVCPGTASASAAPVGHVRIGPPAGPGLARAPAGLRAAVGRTLEVPAAAAASASQQAKLTAADGAANDYFGLSVAIYGSTAVVGAPYKNTGTAAYVFVRSGSAWSQQAELSTASGGEFGWSVAIYGSTAVVGAHFENSQTGAAYVFARSGSAWSQQAKLTAANGARADRFGSSVAICLTRSARSEPSIAGRNVRSS